jgi:hypothetical protein
VAADEIDAWVRTHLRPAGPLELVHDTPWSRVWRVPLPGDAAAWFKACAPVQAFEPRLTAALYRRWPDRIVEVIAHDEERAWLLLSDGGTPVGAFGNSPDAWAAALPLYAELQQGEVAHAGEHLDGGVTDRRLVRLPELYDDMVGRELPLAPEEHDVLRRFAPSFARLCAELAGREIPETIQHDDLHIGNVYAKDDRMLILDWGDASVAHPFFSLVVTFQFLEDVNRLEPGDPAFARLRDAYRVGTFAHAFGWLRLYDTIAPGKQREEFFQWLPKILRRAVASAA